MHLLSSGGPGYLKPLRKSCLGDFPFRGPQEEPVIPTGAEAKDVDCEKTFPRRSGGIGPKEDDSGDRFLHFGRNDRMLKGRFIRSIFESILSFLLLTGSALLAEPPAGLQPPSAHL